MDQIIRWKTIKEDRGEFYVEYNPASPKFPLATLSLVFPRDQKLKSIAGAMEKELRIWLLRYPVPLMVSSFNQKDDVIDLGKIKNCEHLLGFVSPSSGKIISSWRLMKTEELPAEQASAEYLNKVYSELPSVTREEVERKQKNEKTARRIGFFFLFVWLVVVPVSIDLLGFASTIVSLIVLFYSFYKATKRV